MYENVPEMSFGQFILRLVIFGVGGLLCIAVSYTVLVPDREPVPVLSERDSLQLGVSDYPVGWRDRGTTRTEAWRTSNGFVTEFNTRPPASAVSLVFFLQYRSAEDAAEYFTDLQDRVFIPGLQQTTPADLNPSPVAADQYRVNCQYLDEIERDSCAYWGQYGRCLVNFFAQIQRPYMSYTQFSAMINESIDSRMAELNACHSN